MKLLGKKSIICFSMDQVPEMDETYAEDSFVVGSDVEELGSSEEEAEDVELFPEASYVDGRRQYATRRRVFLHKARAQVEIATDSHHQQKVGEKNKRTRIIRVNDSSEEETDEVSTERRLTAGEGVVAVQPEPSGVSASATIASKVSLLSKAQGREEWQNER